MTNGIHHGIPFSEYQQLKASSATGPFPNFYIRGASLYLYPTPTAGHTYAFEFADSRLDASRLRAINDAEMAYARTGRAR